MKMIYKAFKEILGILFAENPYVVIAVFGSAILSGVIAPLSVWINGQIFDRGLSVASGELPFNQYIPYLFLFVALALLPVVVGETLAGVYIQPRCQLILRGLTKVRCS